MRVNLHGKMLQLLFAVLDLGAVSVYSWLPPGISSSAEKVELLIDLTGRSQRGWSEKHWGEVEVF